MSACSVNSFGNGGVAAVADALTNNTTLLALNLSSESSSATFTWYQQNRQCGVLFAVCNVSDDGCSALATALLRNSTLSTLQLHRTLLRLTLVVVDAASDCVIVDVGKYSESNSNHRAVGVAVGVKYHTESVAY